MKKALLIIFTVVALVVFFTACSVTENESETVSTTAITDKKRYGNFAFPYRFLFVLISIK